MERPFKVELLVQKVKEYADYRKKEVERGAETPHLAALLVQKYGLGIVDAVSEIYENIRVADPIYKTVDEEVEKIDPSWKENARNRWEGQPADIVSCSNKEK